MENKSYDKIEALKQEGYDYEEYEVVKNTILLLNEKGFTSHYFNWHVSDYVLVEIMKKGFRYKKGTDIQGKYTLVEWS